MRILSAFLFCLLTATVWSQSFPERCEGIWNGSMVAMSGGKVQYTIEVILVIRQDGNDPRTWIWKTTYNPNSEAEGVKDYRLIEQDAAAGLYLLDEGNGIVLQHYVFGDKMYSAFRVKNYYLTSTYELIGDQLVFEVTSGEKIRQKVTGYSYSHVQRATLSRMQ